MKAFTKREKYQGQNAWGADTSGFRQTFEIDAGDVGSTRENYRGYGHSSYTFKASDIERKIEIMTDGTGWTCWVFLTR
jgi:hypothetical protein